MKKELMFAFAAFFFVSLSAITGAYAVEETTNKERTLLEEKIDVTGDGKMDTVKVIGNQFDNDSELLRNLHIDIEDNNKKEHTIKLESGTEPLIKFSDLNQDGINDLFVSVPTGGSDDLSSFYLYTLKDSVVKELTVPDPLVIQSEFLNGYRAKITIDLTQKTYEFDLKERALNYEKLGLYQNGRLSEPTELKVQSYETLKPVTINGKELGLRGIQTISGASNTDSIATIESTWLYDNEKWSLVDTKIMKTNAKKNQ